MLTIVDCGMGNLGSIENMLKKIGKPALVSSDPETIAKATRLILPGVGAFDHGMASLRERGLETVLRHKASVEKVPLLGVCLGMQLLGRSSEEGSAPGLGFIDAACRRFGGAGWDSRLKIPHMGWNAVRPRCDDPLLAGFSDVPRFYFVHSYAMTCASPEASIGETDYGGTFTSVVRVGNICGVQFHPEKSHRFGMVLYRNFVDGF
jgi:glutamine amidotransferase